MDGGRTGLRRCDREFVTSVPKVRPIRSSCDLANDIREDLVGGSEGNLALHLDFESGADTGRIMRVDDHIVEWSSFGCTLQRGTIDDCAWEASRLCAGEEREKVGSRNLSFEMRPGWTGRCRANAERSRLFAVVR